MTIVRSSRIEQVLEIARQNGVVRPRELTQRGIPHVYLQNLYKRGLLQRSGRGLYFLTDADITVHHSLAEACKRVPHGIICLLSALVYHELTTQNPHQIWMALPPKAHLPRLSYPPLRIVRFSGQALIEGIEEHDVEGVIVNVTSVAKTVADCFKYRNKIGLDVGLEALRECLHYKRCTPDEILHFAKIGRVANVIRPYMEAMLA